MNQLTVQEPKVLQTVDSSSEDQCLYLTFQVGGEAFGVSILGVKEILEYCEITTVPMVPSFIKGVINVRGSVVPVIDLARRLGRKSADITKRTCIVIVEIMSEDEIVDIGVVVDSVNEVMEITPDNIEEAPAFGAQIRTDFIKGMGKIENRFIILLDVKNVLSVEELSLLDQVSGGAEALSVVE